VRSTSVTHSKQNFSGQTILITGAGGCIGSALAKRISACDPSLLLLLDHSEQNLYEIHSELSGGKQFSIPQPFALASERVGYLPILGDISDEALLDEIFERYRPDAVYHAAAFKHVPLMETNPIAVIGNNVLGTWRLANAALRHGVPRLLMISTDKAVNPSSVMGAAKRVAELILLDLSTARTRMSSLRLGNVLGSHGSVVPLLQQQIAAGGPMTITHPEARRYFVPLDDAVKLILAAGGLAEDGCILVPELAEPVKILDLAKRMAHDAGHRNGEIEVVFTGLRPGDKLSEQLISATETESVEPTSAPRLRRVRGSKPSSNQLDPAIRKIREGVASRNVRTLLDALCSLVPEYEPGETVLSLSAGPDRPVHCEPAAFG
jgi:FlaA1/EpsC-like NDP-sugar epimerase